MCQGIFKFLVTFQPNPNSLETVLKPLAGRKGLVNEAKLKSFGEHEYTINANKHTYQFTIAHHTTGHFQTHRHTEHIAVSFSGI
jgi:hypothetical protein